MLFTLIVGTVALIVGATALVTLTFWATSALDSYCIAILNGLASKRGTDTSEIERKISNLTALVNDIDERSEHRYRKLTARARRAEVDDGTAVQQGSVDTDDDDVRSYIEASTVRRGEAGTDTNHRAASGARLVKRGR